MNAIAVLGVSVTTFVATACWWQDSDDDTQNSAHCESTSDCRSGVCAFDECRSLCTSDDDCGRDGLCLDLGNEEGVCRLPEERACERDRDCPRGLVCKSESCRVPCADDDECSLPGQRCVDDACTSGDESEGSTGDRQSSGDSQSSAAGVTPSPAVGTVPGPAVVSPQQPVPGQTTGSPAEEPAVTPQDKPVPDAGTPPPDRSPSETCGDGQVDKLEVCDDGNSQRDDGCYGCLAEAGYSCAEGFQCVFVHTCGDSRIGGNESCDDGNTEPGDGCSSLCQQEANWLCPTPGEPCVYTAQCGDGLLAGSEECDDGNTEPQDGCNEQCELEKGWVCGDGSICRAVCGDGVVQGAETCDDGNATSVDGCSSTCQLEAGWVCEPGERCRQTVCGDGVVEGSEPCDDANSVEGDGCAPNCLLEPDCSGSSCVTVCGDGLWDPTAGEECDDGNLVPGDGCGQCQIEAGYRCVDVGGDLTSDDLFELPSSQCTPSCGDGIVTLGEQCDDADQNGSGYGFCGQDCTLGPRCGDGIADSPTEECDDGINNSLYADGCAPGCVFPSFCGDGLIDAAFGERCDDGLLDGAYDGCMPDCSPAPRCGDGRIDEPEQCDDGNRANGDGCDVACKQELRVIFE